MKKTTYECKKCGAKCNGAGVSFSLIAAADNKAASISMSSDMDAFQDHDCGQEHMSVIFNEAMAAMKQTASARKEE